MKDGMGWLMVGYGGAGGRGGVGFVSRRDGVGFAGEWGGRFDFEDVEIVFEWVTNGLCRYLCNIGMVAIIW